MLQMFLYRGYAGDPLRPQTFSSIAVSSLLENNKDPQEQEFAGKLLWVTPSSKYASRMAISRFIGNFTLADSLEEKVKEGKFMPVLVKFDTSFKEPEIYGVDSDILFSCDKPSKEMIAQDLSQYKREIFVPDKEEVLSLCRKLKDPEHDIAEEAYNATVEYQIRTGRLDFPKYNVAGMSFVEAVRTMIEYDESGKRDYELESDRLAKGIFSWANWNELSSHISFTEQQSRLPEFSTHRLKEAYL